MASHCMLKLTNQLGALRDRGGDWCLRLPCSIMQIILFAFSRNASVEKSIQFATIAVLLGYIACTMCKDAVSCYRCSVVCVVCLLNTNRWDVLFICGEETSIDWQQLDAQEAWTRCLSVTMATVSAAETSGSWSTSVGVGRCAERSWLMHRPIAPIGVQDIGHRWHHHTLAR